MHQVTSEVLAKLDQERRYVREYGGEEIEIRTRYPLIARPDVVNVQDEDIEIRSVFGMAVVLDPCQPENELIIRSTKGHVVLRVVNIGEVTP